MRSAVIFAGAALLAACTHHEEIVAGPGGLPYLCGDGRAARIFYDGGDPNRMPARLSFDGHDYQMAPDPALSGLRYRSEEGPVPGHALVWAAQGDEAALIEVAAEGEREIVRCARIREGESAPAAEEHGEDH